MKLYTIGFTQKSAETFFSLIKKNNIELLIDIRLNNKSQLAGFAKGEDLKFFLKNLSKCEYKYLEEYAPTKEILEGYRKKLIDWDTYIKQYNELLEKRGDYKKFVEKFSSYEKVCLLCSEATAEKCHRRLMVEIIKKANPKIEIIHI